MARIQLTFPEKAIYKTEIPVRITDINYGNHLGNDSLLSILHEARLQFLNSLGYSEMNLEGSGVIMADVAIQFKAEAVYGDLLMIEIAVADPGRAGFDIFYRVTSSEKLIAIAKTGIVCYNYSAKTVVSLSEKFLQKIHSQ